MNIGRFENHQTPSSIFQIVPTHFLSRPLPPLAHTTVVASLPLAHTINARPVAGATSPGAWPPPPGYRSHTIAAQPPSPPHHLAAASSSTSRPVPGHHCPTAVARPSPPARRHRLVAWLPPHPMPDRCSPTTATWPPSLDHPRAFTLDPAPMPPLPADLYAVANSGEVSTLSNFVVGIRNLNVGMNYFDLNVGNFLFELNVSKLLLYCLVNAFLVYI
jgi:hypothetical protein